MDTPLPTGVRVTLDEEKMVAVITSVFSMSDNTVKQFNDMNDEQVIEALRIATRVGVELEGKGYKVKY